ncbi:hypothetical protein SAMN05880501_101120 [Ureibacillus xyleni]|uniref:Uncharacterized protein n=1 Tax=Ureibacillus xyleni TaxID=614648 RepID=A0A285R7Z0_9BACL|nr:hypothetical protein [Ureibacillus xyleni]SOB90223.1 hypothetical protein SAMN05880501_101120 [Ureibacillus xyleni]
MVMFEVSIPQTNNYSAFQWTLTILENPMQRRKIQYASCNFYEEMEQIEINGFTYEKLIFDFQKGKLHITLKNNDPKAVLNILNALTIHTSPTSQMYFLNPGRRRRKRET